MGEVRDFTEGNRNALLNGVLYDSLDNNFSSEREIEEFSTEVGELVPEAVSDFLSFFEFFSNMGTTINRAIQDVVELFINVDEADLELRMKLKTARDEARILLAALQGLNQMISGGTGLKNYSQMDFLNMAEGVIFQIELTRALDAMFPYIDGKRQVCWDTLEEVLGRLAEDISLLEYAVISIIFLNLESDTDINNFIQLLAVNEGLVWEWDPVFAANSGDITRDCVMWSFCPIKIANIQQFMYFEAGINLAAIMYGNLTSDQIRGLESANDRILDRITLLSAVASLTPMLYDENYSSDDGIHTYAGFRRQVVLGNANGPTLNFDGVDGETFVRLDNIRTLTKHSDNTNGILSRRIIDFSEEFSIPIENAILGYPALSSILDTMEQNFLHAFARPPSLSSAAHKEVGKKLLDYAMKGMPVFGLGVGIMMFGINHIEEVRRADANRALIEGSFDTARMAGLTGEFQFNIGVFGDSIQLMPTVETFEMVERFNNVLQDENRPEWVTNAIVHVRDYINSDFSYPISVSDLTNENFDAIYLIYNGINIYEDGRRVTIPGLRCDERTYIRWGENQ